MGGGVRRPGSRSDSSAAKCCSSAGLSPAEAEHDGRLSPVARLSPAGQRPPPLRHPIRAIFHSLEPSGRLASLFLGHSIGASPCGCSGLIFTLFPQHHLSSGSLAPPDPTSLPATTRSGHVALPAPTARPPVQTHSPRPLRNNKRLSEKTRWLGMIVPKDRDESNRILSWQISA